MSQNNINNSEDNPSKSQINQLSLNIREQINNYSFKNVNENTNIRNTISPNTLNLNSHTNTNNNVIQRLISNNISSQNLENINHVLTGTNQISTSQINNITIINNNINTKNDIHQATKSKSKQKTKFKRTSKTKTNNKNKVKETSELKEPQENTQIPNIKLQNKTNNFDDVKDIKAISNLNFKTQLPSPIKANVNRKKMNSTHSVDMRSLQNLKKLSTNKIAQSMSINDSSNNYYDDNENHNHNANDYNKSNNIDSNSNNNVKKIINMKDIEQGTAHLEKKEQVFLQKKRHLTTKKNLDHLINDVSNYAQFSIFLFSRSNAIRRLIFQIINNKYFDVVVTFHILLNSIVLAVNLSLDQKFVDDVTWEKIEIYFVVVYSIEAIFKLIAWGFIEGNKAYIKEVWNILDGIVVVASILTQFIDDQNFGVIRNIRLFRPLRSLFLLPQLKLLVTMLTESLKKLLNILMLLILLYIFFGAFGLNVYNGVLSKRCRINSHPKIGYWNPIEEEILCSGHYKCLSDRKYDSLFSNEKAQYDLLVSENTVETCASLTKTYDEGLYFFSPQLKLKQEQKIEALNYGYNNFNNFLYTLLTLFQCSTLSGWTTMLYLHQNGYNYYSASAYFIIVILIFRYFIINFCIGIMFNSSRENFTYHQLKIINDFNDKYSDNDIKHKIIDKKMIKNMFVGLYNLFFKATLFKYNISRIFKHHYKYSFTYYIYIFVEQPIFSFIMHCCTIINIIAMALYEEDMESKDKKTINDINTIMMCTFIFEFVVKLLGFGFRHYFKDKLNWVDCFVVLSSILEIAINSKVLGVCATIKILRIVDILKKFKGMRVIVRCISETVKEMISYIILMIIIMFCFALLGMNLFKNKLFFDDNMNFDSEGELYYINFQNIYRAMVSVFILMIGDSWNAYFNNFLRSGVENKALIWIYILILILVLNIVLLNLVIAFLVFHFEKIRKIIDYEEKYEIWFRRYKLKRNKRSLSVSFDLILHIRDFLTYEKGIKSIRRNNNIDASRKITIKHYRNSSNTQVVSIKKEINNNKNRNSRIDSKRKRNTNHSGTQIINLKDIGNQYDYRNSNYYSTQDKLVQKSNIVKQKIQNLRKQFGLDVDDNKEFNNSKRNYMDNSVNINNILNCSIINHSRNNSISKSNNIMNKKLTHNSNASNTIKERKHVRTFTHKIEGSTMNFNNNINTIDSKKKELGIKLNEEVMNSNSKFNPNKELATPRTDRSVKGLLDSSRNGNSNTDFNFNNFYSSNKNSKNSHNSKVKFVKISNNSLDISENNSNISFMHRKNNSSISNKIIDKSSNNGNKSYIMDNTSNNFQVVNKENRKRLKIEIDNIYDTEEMSSNNYYQIQSSLTPYNNDEVRDFSTVIKPTTAKSIWDNTVKITEKDEDEVNETNNYASNYVHRIVFPGNTKNKIRNINVDNPRSSKDSKKEDQSFSLISKMNKSSNNSNNNSNKANNNYSYSDNSKITNKSKKKIRNFSSKNSVLKKHFGQEAAELANYDPTTFAVFTPSSSRKLNNLKKKFNMNRKSPKISREQEDSLSIKTENYKKLSNKSNVSPFSSSNKNNINDLNDLRLNKNNSNATKTTMNSLAFNNLNSNNSINRTNDSNQVNLISQILEKNIKDLKRKQSCTMNKQSIETQKSDSQRKLESKASQSSQLSLGYFNSHNANDRLIIKSHKRRNNILKLNNEFLKNKYWQRRSNSEVKEISSDINSNIVVQSTFKLLEMHKIESGEYRKNKDNANKEPSEFVKYIKKSSLCIFHIDSKIRRWIIWLCNQKLFDFSFIIMTFISCIIIVMQNNYVDPKSSEFSWLKNLDKFFIILFFIENLLKIIAYGFIFDNYKALGDPSEMKMSEKLEQMELQEMSISEIDDTEKNKTMKDSLIGNNIDDMKNSRINNEGSIMNNDNNQKYNLEMREYKNSKSNISDNNCDDVEFENKNKANVNNNMNSLNNLAFYKENSTNKFSYTDAYSINQDKKSNKYKDNEESNYNNIKENDYEIKNNKNNANNGNNQSSILSLNKESYINYYDNMKLKEEKMNLERQRKKKLRDIYNKTKFVPGLRKAFLKDFINVIDLITVISSMLYLISYEDLASAESKRQQNLKILRALGALRPIKLASKFQEMRVAVECLLMSIPAIVKMFIIGFFVFLAFGIAGIHLFEGKIGECSVMEFTNSEECRKNNFIWTSEPMNFDKISNALLSLLQMSTAQGWVKTMRKSETVTSVASNLFFLLFMMLCSIFVINIAVTVIVDNYIRLSEAEQGLSILTDDQKTWLKTMKIFLKYRPTPKLIPQKLAFPKKHSLIIVSDPIFKHFINLVILVNVIGILINYDRAPEEHTNFQKHLFYTCTGIFNVEIILKIIAYGKFFFIYNWNIFDLVVIVLGDIQIILEIIISGFDLSYLFDNTAFNTIYIILNSTKALRVVRVINMHQTLREYVSALLLILPSLLNIGLLIFVNLFVFAIIGMTLFGTIKHHSYVNINVNFETFWNSVLILIRANTGEEWNGIMNELAVKQEGCIEYQAYSDLKENGPNGCGSSLAYPFFVVFIIYNTFIVMNMLVAVIVEGFIYNIDKEIQISEEDIELFFGIWGSYDKEIKYEISVQDFALMLLDLPEPLGIFDIEYPRYESGRVYSKNIFISQNEDYILDHHKCLLIYQNLDIPCLNGKITIIDAIKLIINRVFTQEQFNSDNNLEELNEKKKLEAKANKKKIASNYLLNKKLEGIMNDFWKTGTDNDFNYKIQKEPASIYLAKISLRKFWKIYKKKKEREDRIIY